MPTRELEPRPNHAPHDGRSPKHLRARARKPVLLVCIANIRDVLEHPRLHAELRRARDNGRDHLRGEHRARRDFHVVPELEVRRECQSLGHRDVSPRLEQHHRDWTAWQKVSDNELGDHV